MSDGTHILRAEARMTFGSGLFWLLTLATGGSALAFAGWGWYLTLTPDVSPREWTDVIVRTVKVLLLSDIYYDESKLPADHMWLFETGRTLGVAFSLLVAGRLLLFALGSKVTGRLLGLRRNHDVVIGDAQAATEYAFHTQRREVTHIVSGMETSGGRVSILHRAGTLKQQLAKAGAKKARRLVVAETSDAETWNTAQAAAKEMPRVEVLAYIGDSWVQDHLSRASPEASLRTFSYAGGVARQVMLAHPPYLLARRFNAAAQHIIVVGFGPVGQAIAREFLVTSVSSKPADMMITVIDADAKALQSDFEGRHPGLRDAVDLKCLNGDIRGGDETLFDAIRERTAKAPACAIYVAVGESDLPLSVGVALRDRAERLQLFRAPIFICAHQGAGLPVVRQGAGNVGKDKDAPSPAPGAMLEERRLVSFGSWRDAFDGSGLLEPSLDSQARAFHDSFRRLMKQKEPNRPPRQSELPWEQLDDEFRVANRRAAAHARAKIDAVGFDLDAWLVQKPGGWETHELPAQAAADFNLDDPAEMDGLSELEHRRWMIDRLLNGWRYGATRDNSAKIHPDLKPNRELSDDAREKDRNNIRETAAILQAILRDSGKKK